MKSGILLLILIIFSCKNKQNETNISEFNDPIFVECDSLTKNAEKDYQNGIREYTIMGTVYLTEFEKYYSDFMKEKYNITIKANCVPDFPKTCYEESLNYEIEEEYGKDFIKLTREKAEIEFNKKRN